MKKILSIFLGFILCLFLVGCDDTCSQVPFDYSSYEAQANLQDLAKSSGFLIEYSVYSNLPDSSRMIDYDDDYGWDDDDYDYDDDDYGSFDGFDGFGFTKLTLAVKGDILYMATEQYAMYLDYSNETKAVIYMGISDPVTNAFKWQKEEFVYTAEITKEYVQEQYDDFYEYLIPYSSLYGTMVKAKYSDAVCGRMCQKYVLDGSSMDEDMEGDTIICIDNEYGLCLKMGMEMKYEGKKYSYGIQCSRFDMYPIISLPAA